MNKKNPAKVCVFCGAKPISKTKEHIFPQWLIKLTGNPNRIANFGGLRYQKKFAFDQFTFPACKDCNEKFAELEGNAKGIMSKLLESERINESEAEILLDWFDKLRIGHWLASLMLFENPEVIKPKFHIASRISKKDRLFYIAWAEKGRKALHFSWLENPIFEKLPCFMTLYVNGFHFITASTDGLCGAAMGFPKIKLRKAVNGGMVELEATSPPRIDWRENWPVAPKGFSILAQAIYPEGILDKLKEEEKSHNHAHYRRRMQRGMIKSRVHLYRNGKLEMLGQKPISILSPSFKNSQELWDKVALLYYKLQKHIVKRTKVRTNNPQHRAEHRLLMETADNLLRICIRKIKQKSKRKRKGQKKKRR